MNRIVQLTLKDALMFPSGGISPATYACVIFLRVPPDWLAGQQLKPEGFEKVFEKMYGPTWRQGNSDGSRYHVMSQQARVLTPEEEAAAPWREVVKSQDFQYWFYRVDPAGELEQAEASAL